MNFLSFRFALIFPTDRRRSRAFFVIFSRKYLPILCISREKNEHWHKTRKPLKQIELRNFANYTWEYERKKNLLHKWTEFLFSVNRSNECCWSCHCAIQSEKSNFLRCILWCFSSSSTLIENFIRIGKVKRRILFIVKNRSIYSSQRKTRTESWDLLKFFNFL